MAATDKDILYEGVFGSRDLATGDDMTGDTVFRIASMTKAVTSTAAMQLVEQGKLKLEDPVPNIDPVLGTPQVLEGFDASGAPKLRPAKRPITLRHLLTHTAGFGYEVWDADMVRYVRATGMPSTPTGKLASIRMPLIFDPGERWEYGVNTDWVGRIVDPVSGKPLDAYFRDHIFGPLGMKDTDYVFSQQQQARLVSVHQAQAGRLAGAAAADAPFTPEFWSGGGGLYSTAARLSDLHTHAAAPGGSFNGTRMSQARNNGADEPQPDRRHRGGLASRQLLRRVQPMLISSRSEPQMGARLHDQRAAGTERPQRRHRDLGRHLQHALLDRPGTARDWRDHDAGAPVWRPARNEGLWAIRARRVRFAEVGVTIRRHARCARAAGSFGLATRICFCRKIQKTSPRTANEDNA